MYRKQPGFILADIFSGLSLPFILHWFLSPGSTDPTQAYHTQSQRLSACFLADFMPKIYLHENKRRIWFSKCTSEVVHTTESD